MKRIVFVFLLIQSVSAFSQIREEIKNYQDSTDFYYTNGLSLLYDKLEQNDKQGAIEVYSFLNDLIKHDDYHVFTKEETMLYFLLTNQFDALLNLASGESFRAYYRRFSYKYNYNERLDVLFSNQYEDVKEQIELTVADEEGKELLLLLAYYLEHENYDLQYKSMYNSFKKKYKGSEYWKFFNYYLPNPVQTQYYYLSLGGGTTFYQDGLQKDFTPEMMFHFNIGLYLNKFHGSFSWLTGKAISNISFSGTSADMELQFDKNERFDFNRYSGNFGYVLVNNRFVTIIPLVSVGGSRLKSDRFSNSSNDNAADDSDENAGNYKEYDVYHSFIIGPGINTQIKIYSNVEQRYGGGLATLQISAGYDFLTTNRFDSYKSNMPYVSVGLSWGLGFRD